MTKTYIFHRVPALYAFLNSLSKEAQKELRNASVRIAAVVAADAAGRARRVGGVATLVAPTIRASRDRVPAIKMGSTRKIVRHRKSKTPKGLKVNVDAGALNMENQTIGNVVWGAEFGGGRRSTTHQFDPWRGNKERAGYFLWPSVRAHHDFIEDEYGDALMDAVDADARRTAH